jgi:hypothetical protein
MTDLHTRLKSLDDMSTPNLWHTIEERAMVAQPTPRRLSWVLIAVALLLALAIGGAALVGSGIVKLPASVDDSPSPDSSVTASPTPASPFPAPVTATWAATGAMIEARAGNTATLLPDGKVLVTGGETGGTADRPLASAELYDPRTGTWTATGSMNEARTGHAAVLLPDGKVLVVGGASAPTYFPSDLLTSAELFDPRSGTWTVTASLHAVRRDQVALLLQDGTVLVVGGSDGSEAYPVATERYDPVRGTWTVAANIIEDLSVWAATSLSDGTVLIVGGPGEASPAELYDPGTGIWSATGNVIEPYCGPVGSMLLRTGKVLLICGHVVGPETLAVSAELYDPATGIWTVSGSMHGKSQGGLAVLLADGRVLALTDDLPQSAELYDPITGSWTATASLEGVFAGGHGTLLQDGRVLFAGGGNGTGVVASAALYDPGSGN